MQQTDRPDCYGTMFPDVLRLPADRTVSGKVFSVRVDRAGGMMLRDRSIAADENEWHECLQCRQFENCYRFSMAKLSLATALGSV